MAVKVCPRCGGEIVSGVCFSCGHHPEEDEAVPDFVNPYASASVTARTETAVPDPASPYAGGAGNVRTETASVSPYYSGDTVTVQAETTVPDFVNPYANVTEAAPQKEAVPEIPEIPEIPSIELPEIPASPTAKLHAPIKRKTKEEKAAEKAEQYGKKNFVPYVKPVYGNAPSSEQTPETAVKAVSDFVIRHWWKLLLVAFVPTVGIAFGFFGIVTNRIGDRDSKKSEIVLAVMMFILTAVLWAANWDPSGIDHILRYFIFEV